MLITEYVKRWTLDVMDNLLLIVNDLAKLALPLSITHTTGTTTASQLLFNDRIINYQQKRETIKKWKNVWENWK